MSTALAELRHALQERFPDALPLGRGIATAVATGLGPLDRVLPGGGLARGRVTLWEPGGGATAVLRAACAAAVERGERAAWVDGARQLVVEEWDSRVLLVRPEGEVEALVCAEELLRCGGFALVVLAGAARSGGSEAVRLGRSAKAGGGAFVLLGREATVAHMRVSSRIRPDDYRWRTNPFGEPVSVSSLRLEVEARSLGWTGRARLELAVGEHPYRLSQPTGLVDRRGAPPQVRWRRANVSKKARIAPRGND